MVNCSPRNWSEANGRGRRGCEGMNRVERSVSNQLLVRERERRGSGRTVHICSSWLRTVESPISNTVLPLTHSTLTTPSFSFPVKPPKKPPPPPPSFFFNAVNAGESPIERSCRIERKSSGG